MRSLSQSRASYASRSKLSLRGSSAPSLGSLRLSAIPPKKQSAIKSRLVPGSFVSVLSEWSNSHASGGLSIDRLVRVVTLVADCAIGRMTGIPGAEAAHMAYRDLPQRPVSLGHVLNCSMSAAGSIRIEVED